MSAHAVVGPVRRRLPSAFTCYVTAVIAAGVVVGVFALTRPGQWVVAVPGQWTVLLVLSTALVAGELRPIPISRAGDHTDFITISTTFAVALVILGPVSVALVAQCVAVVLDFFPNRTRLRNLTFNVCQYVLTVTVSRWVFTAIAGHVAFGGPYALFDPRQPRQLLAGFAAGLAFLVVNHTLISTVLALQRRTSVLEVIVSDIRFQALTSAVLVSMGPMAALTVQIQWLMLPLLGAPLVAVYRSAQLAVERQRQAQHDALTGLSNRELFRERSTVALSDTLQSGGHLAVMMVDLDHFKQVNDTLGHQVGDELIVEVARRLEVATPPGATVARLGGDEFAVLLPDVTGLGHAEAVAGHLLDQLGGSFQAGGMRLAVQASIGIALAPEHGDDVHTLMRRADVALYEAKKERARCSSYRPEADENTPQRLEIAGDLLVAVDECQFFLEYQPKLHLASGIVEGVEALVRWNDPRRGVIGPDDFIPHAESTGLITAITWFVLDESLEQLAQWRGRGVDVTMAINLSTRHLTDLDLPGRIAAALAGHGVPPDRLIVEVTESGVMSDPQRAVGVIKGLRSVGVSVSVDDYGTGQTSLAYLQRLDVDELKIDRQFIVGLDPTSSDGVIVSSTIDMGHNLGLRIVAEGVEDAATLHWLTRAGCDVAQGFHVGRPMSAGQVEHTLGRRLAPVGADREAHGASVPLQLVEGP